MSLAAPPPPIRAVVADDEPLGRERIRIFLDQLRSRLPVEVLRECADGREAVEAVQSLRPDLLFLDIAMPDLDGFGVLAELARSGLSPLPRVIFVTAHDEHAVRAFETHALDFLLKPVPRERFTAALQRAFAAIAEHRQPAVHQQLLAWITEQRPPAVTASPPASTKTWIERLTVRNPHQWDYVPVSQVIFFQADGNYIEIHTRERTHLIRETVGTLEKELNPAQFLRIGRSVIVNLGAVQAIRPQGRGTALVVLSDGTKLPVQRNFHELQERLPYVPAASRPP